MVDEKALRHYLPLVHRDLRRYRSHTIEREDLLQEGILAVLVELQNEGPDEDLRVRRAINRRIRQLVRAAAARYSHEAHPTDEDGDPLIEEIAIGADNCQPIIENCWFDWMVSHLRGRQRQCVDLYFREGMTQGEVGERLAMRQQDVSQAIRGGIKNLRKLMTDG